MKKHKKEPWRIAVFTLSLAFIVFMWIKNDVASIYTTAPKEQIAPMIATTVAVSLLKVLLLAGAILIIKWTIEKIRNK